MGIRYTCWRGGMEPALKPSPGQIAPDASVPLSGGSWPHLRLTFEPLAGNDPRPATVQSRASPLFVVGAFACGGGDPAAGGRTGAWSSGVVWQRLYPLDQRQWRHHSG